MKEQDLERSCCELAKSLGWLSFKGFSRNGGPDRIFFHGGRCFCVEFKIEGGKINPNQKVEEKIMRENGTPYHYCYSIGEFRDLLLAEERKQ